ncbi:MAG: decaprenyl-phosphate phosphoribosyltransferase [Chloroflexi bacterium]|nr:decaprenyl-phosphate phosphoribosyltransferase [Chloroflexota bacterium]
MFRGLIKSMRPRQWTKNIFLLAAIVFDRQLTNMDALLRTIIGIVIFSLLSSSIYLINDIADIEADRNHPDKRKRPIANGIVPVKTAVITAILLIIITLVLAFFLSTGFGWICVLYFAINMAYSKWLKHVPIIDVMVLASGYVLRVAAGVSLIVVERFSPWLYVVTTLFALLVGFGKRRTELNILQEEAHNHRRVLDGYTIPFLDQLITIVSSTIIVAYSLYTFSAPNLPANHSMMLTIPFVMYGIFRYLYLIQVKELGGAPEELALTDRPLQATFLLWGFLILLIFYLT